jgi:SAM-dependent methyltransferase
MPFEELKARQSVIWGSAEYEPIVGLTREVHEALIERLKPTPGEAWLDVATGTGAVALRAAKAGADVTALDLAPALIEAARRRAGEEQVAIKFDVGDAEALPYADSSFDVVASALGTQFAPDHRAVANELARVCRPGSRLGLACWTPESGVAGMFGVMQPFLPPPAPGAGNVFDWGRPEYVEDLLGAAFELSLEQRDTVLRARSGEEVWQIFSTHYGPTKTLAEGLDPERRHDLHRAWVEFFEGFRRDGGIEQSRTYLLVLGRRTAKR